MKIKRNGGCGCKGGKKRQPKITRKKSKKRKSKKSKGKKRKSKKR